jgi:hypothetical protein
MTKIQAITKTPYMAGVTSWSYKIAVFTLYDPPLLFIGTCILFMWGKKANYVFIFRDLHLLIVAINSSILLVQT